MALLTGAYRSRIATDVAPTPFDLVERRDEELRQRGVRPADDRNERLVRHQQSSREALGVLLIVGRATGSAGVDGVAVEAQRGDEAAFGVVGLEDLDVRG